MLRKVTIAVGILFTGAIVAMVLVVAFFDFNRLKPVAADCNEALQTASSI